MKQSKTIYLIIALIIMIVLLVLVQIFKSSEKTSSTSNTEESTPIVQFTPAPKFKIVSTDIPDKPIELDQPIKIIFDRPVNNESLTLEVTPKEEVLILFDQTLTEMAVKPANAWNFNTRYTIKVSRATKAQDYQFLDKDYEFAFQTRPFVGI